MVTWRDSAVTHGSPHDDAIHVKVRAREVDWVPSDTTGARRAPPGGLQGQGARERARRRADRRAQTLLEVAEAELMARAVPLGIRRYLPDGSVEDWTLEELVIGAE